MVEKVHASVTAVGEGLYVTEYNMPTMDQLWDDNVFTEDIYITIETDSTFNFSEFRVLFATNIETIDDGTPEIDYYDIDIK